MLHKFCFIILFSFFHLAAAIPNLATKYNYTFSLDALGFFDANSYCYQSGGNLASVKNAFENKRIFQEAQKAFANINMVDYWLGGYKEEDGKLWLWIDGEDFRYDNWGNGEWMVTGKIERI